jgi:hypothetical protein
MVEDRSNMWKMIAVGVVVAGVTAVITGVVVANRVGVSRDAQVAPSAAPSAVVSPPPVAQAPAPPPLEPVAPAARKGVPSQAVVAQCNRVASNVSGPERTRNDKIIEAAKDAGIGALGGAAVGALGGAIADGGKGAGKGALIGGGVGAGAGTLYGIYDNKKHDERYRSAYADCMRSKGYTT